MNAGLFVIALAVGAAVLALWVEVRVPRLAPTKFIWVLANLLAAVVGLHLGAAALEKAGGLEPRFAALFGAVLPALTYVFLSALWLMRAAQSALSGSVR